MRWSLRTSRRMAAAVWPLRCRDADVQRSARPSGSGRRPRARPAAAGAQKTKLAIVVGEVLLPSKVGNKDNFTKLKLIIIRRARCQLATWCQLPWCIARVVWLWRTQLNHSRATSFGITKQCASLLRQRNISIITARGAVLQICGAFHAQIVTAPTSGQSWCSQ